MTALAPLSGIVVLDLSRMLPGAALARMLVDLGARVIKVEDPGVGDPMRSAPPLVDGVGAGFRAFMRGTESVGLDLRSPDGQAALRKLARQADVLVESFRPGTMERWGLGPDRLAALNAGLVTVSLSGFGGGSPRVAHDLNLMAASGLLSLLPDGADGRIPQVQVADVTTGMLACSAVLAALLLRHRTHRGMHLDQPLAAAPLPFLTWAAADHAAGAPGLPATVLAGDAAAYGVYACADGRKLAVGAIEPKFWAEFAEVLGLPDLAGAGLTVGPAGADARARVAARLAEKPRDAWLAAIADRNLPINAVNDLDEASADPDYGQPPRRGAIPAPSGDRPGPGAWMPAWAPDGLRPAPALGADSARVLAEFGVPAAAGARG